MKRIRWKKLFYDRLAKGPMNRNELILSLYGEIPAEVAYRIYTHWQEKRIADGTNKMIKGPKTTEVIAGRTSMIKYKLREFIKIGYIVDDEGMIKLK